MLKIVLNSIKYEIVFLFNHRVTLKLKKKKKEDLLPTFKIYK